MTAGERAAYGVAYVVVFGTLALLSGLRAAAVMLATLGLLEALAGDVASALLVTALAWVAIIAAIGLTALLDELAR